MTVIKINAITVPADSGDELAHRFAARAGAVDDQDGFEGFELLKPTDDRTTWLVVTRWRDEAAFEAWVSSPAFAHGHRSTSRPEGSDTGDALEGADGNDRLVGAKGDDAMNGGTGNDTLVWNNGDASDIIDGDLGVDTTDVNGNPTLGDAFTLEPNAGRIKFQRVNLVPFTLDAATERFEVNGLAGDDFLQAEAGEAAVLW